MKAAYTFEAEARTDAGKGAARELRRNGKIPAVLYSHGRANQSFALIEKDIATEYKKGAFLNKLVSIKVGGQTLFAIPKDLQFHPVTDRIEHADFLQVEKDSTVKVKVPVKVSGAEKSMGIKRGGTLNIVRHEVELICAPESIPSKIEVDIAGANIGDSIHISAITLPEGVTPVIKNRDFTLVTIAGRGGKDEEETTGTPGAAAAVPATKAKEPAAAAKPAAKK